MSGHSKWHNIENSFLTASTVSKNEQMLLAQFVQQGNIKNNN